MQKERLIWIDWAKAIAIAIVVFCHIPSNESLLKSFFYSMQMPLFFFVSGYLHHSRSTLTESLKKYWKAIIIPYLLYQIIFYPYWIFQSTSKGVAFDGITDVFVFPLLKCLYGTPINGVTWFLVAIVGSYLVSDITHKWFKNNKFIYILGVLTAVTSCFINRMPIDHQISFTLLSFVNLFPFFCMGKAMKQHTTFFEKTSNYPVLGSCLVLTIALILLTPTLLSLTDSFAGQTITKRMLFYVEGTFGTLFLIICCKKFTRKRINIIENVSNGTILILGLHWMFIGTFNFILKKLLHIEGEILYNIPQALLMTAVIMLIHYFLIRLCSRYCKVLLGGR